MALNAFQFTGGGNVSVGPTPLAVQVAGPTIVITNIGEWTVYGSLGGSASGSLSPATYIPGQAVGGTGGGNTATGVSGIAILPRGVPVTLSVGANSWIWLATQAQPGAVNIANGT